MSLTTKGFRAAMVTRELVVDLSVRYGGVIFPFRIESLAEHLPHFGFIVQEGVEAQFGLRVSVSGPLATKGDLRLMVHTDRRTVSVRGHDCASVVEAFESIEELLTGKLRFPSKDRAQYYEWALQVLVDSADRRAVVETQRHFEDVPALARFGRVLGRPVANYGFRLVPTGQIPNSDSWFDVRVEPDVLQADHVYFVSAVFRDPSRAEVMAIVTRGLALVEDVIRTLEG